MTSTMRGFRPEFLFTSIIVGVFPLLTSCAQSEHILETSLIPQQTEAQSPQEDFDARIQEAESLVQLGHFNDALNLLDTLRGSSEFAETTPFWLFYANTTQGFLQQRLAEGERDGNLIADLHREIAKSFQRVLTLDPTNSIAWTGQIAALRQAGDFFEAWASAQKARAACELSPTQLVECGRAALAFTIEELQAGKSAPAAATEGANLLTQAVDAGHEDAPIVLSDLYAWMGLAESARDTLVSALMRQGQNDVLMGRLKNLSGQDTSLLVRDLERIRVERPADGWLLWFIGEAHYFHQVAMRNARDFSKAYESLDRAEESFQQARGLRADFANSCDQWLHLVRCGRGWALWQEGRVDDAAQAFLTALEVTPEMLEPSPETGTLRLGIEAVVGDAFQNRDMTRARSILRRVTQVHTQDAMWFNNLGLACRDIAEPQVRRLNLPLTGLEVFPTLPDDLGALFEESWSAYSAAVALAPGDPNIVNDHALIAVYYLDHDLDVAEKGLHIAISLGEERLLTIDKELEPEVWRRTDMAVGDAWENLAYIDLMRYERTDRAAQFLDKSNEHWPFQNRDGVRRLRRVLRDLSNPDQP